MNQMAQCDAKVSRYKHNLDKYSKEVQELSKVVLRKEEELQNVTIAAGITEATIRENFDADRIKYEEEVASLRKIVSGELLAQPVLRTSLNHVYTHWPAFRSFHNTLYHSSTAAIIWTL